MLQALLDGPASTSQLAQYSRAPIRTARLILIHLHHLLIIRIVAVRSVDGCVPASSYDRDYIWELTSHGLDHATNVPGCRACQVRAERILLAGGFL